MLLMSTAQHLLGLLGAPRRTAYTGYAHDDALAWFDGLLTNHVTMAVGGSILFLSAALLVFIVIQLWWLAPKADEQTYEAFPIAESDSSMTPRFLENWKIWIGIAFLLIALAYTIPLAEIIQHAPPGSGRFQTW